MKKGNSSYDVIPKFFKVYLPGDSGDDLELPISFNGYLPNYLPKNVTLRGSHGNIWETALRKCGGEKYVMVNGWKMILENEDLKGGDFLVFEFDGSRRFNFCIYEPDTMCKKLRRNSVQSNEIKVESDSEDQTRAIDDVLGLDDDDDEEDDSDDSDYNYGDDAAVEDHDDDDDYADDAAVKDGNDVEAVDVDEADIVDDDEVEAVDAAGKDDDDVEVVDVDEAAVVDDDEVDADDDIQYLDDHENPSFTLTLNPNRRSQLLVPARVIKDYDLHFPESITLVDPLVKKFGPMEKKMKIQRNGSVFVKGFGTVIRRNKVKTTDKMIFEIKKIGNNNLVHTIKIHIVSA